MDRFFDWLGEFLRNLLDRQGGSFGAAGNESQDPFMREAYAELDEYLRTGRSRSRPAADSPRAHARQAAPSPPEELRRDYANLEVPFGAPFEQVRLTHRRLLRQYHPDRFGRDPGKQRLATQITQKLNESFQRIRAYAEREGGGD
jgi:DnaJ-domain-containing protein 1